VPAAGPPCHHHAAASGPAGRRLRHPGAAWQPLGDREPRARQRAGHQHRRPAAGT
jgi:hypothetical protein